ncbi:hypothetical protein DW842_18345 [Ruminococcus sp. AM36-17]|nr:hypothetical protein DWW20_20065 [Ruminococcus sp. AF14-5]RHT06857.1 hypothetical protein DW842_18345 [Ruminococcus sp. AM36-17]
MRIEIKLYSYHDLDLVSLYKTGRIAFPETTRQVLNSYARKEVYKVRPLPLNENRAAKYPQKMYRKFYHYHVDLDNKEDADAIRLMRTITDGYRNNFIKSVLRQYLCGIFTEEYSKEGDARFFNEMSRRIQGDRDEKDIKQVKRNKGNNTKKYQKNTSRKEAVYKESDNMSDETQLAAEKRISGETADKDEYVNMNTEVSLGNFGDSDTAEPKNQHVIGDADRIAESTDKLEPKAADIPGDTGITDATGIANTTIYAETYNAESNIPSSDNQIQDTTPRAKMSDALQRLLARDNDNNTDSSVTSNEVKTEPVNNTDEEEAEDFDDFLDDITEQY